MPATARATRIALSRLRPSRRCTAQQTGLAIRALLVSGLLAAGALSALSALAKTPHDPHTGIIRATLAPPPAATYRPPALAPNATLEPQKLDAASILAMERGAQEQARPDYGFAKIFSTILDGKPDELGLSSDMLKFGPMRVRQDLVATILRAAQHVDADPVLLMAIADKESSFATGIGAATSSAVGLFQFVEGTWFNVLRDFGAKHGWTREAALVASDESLDSRERTRILELRKDPYLAALMAAEMLKKDARDIGAKLGRNLSREEIYLAHFLGPSDAYKFLAKVETQPKLVAAKLLPKPARANKPVFYAHKGTGAKSLSVAQVHRKIEQSMGLRLDRYRNVAEAMPSLTAYR